MAVIWMAPKKFCPEFREQVMHAVIDGSRTVADVARRRTATSWQSVSSSEKR